MKFEHVNPDTIFDAAPYGFTQVVVTEGKRTIHISGQTSQDLELNVIGKGDLALQAATAFENLGRALAAVGAGPQHVASIRMYVVQYKPDQLEVVLGAAGRFFGDHPPAASTMIGVYALALPDFLIEVEATAVMD